MFGLVHCNASILAQETTDPKLFFVRTLVKNWLWPIITFFGNYNHCFHSKTKLNYSILVTYKIMSFGSMYNCIRLKEMSFEI